MAFYDRRGPYIQYIHILEMTLLYSRSTYQYESRKTPQFYVARDSAPVEQVERVGNEI